jgi:uncharacterized protein YkwD
MSTRLAHTAPLWLLAACSAPAGIDAARAALGQPSGDYPNYDERVVLYGTNRARAEPGKEGWSSYPAQPPLQWNLALNQSSRAHSIDMRDTPCFQHESCNGTDPWTRITSYYTTAYQSIGENISAGVPDGLTAVHNWLYEIGAAPGETGHRDNIFSADFTFMGSGFAAGGTQFTNYWTQDFIGNPVTRPALTDGIHFPVSAASGKSVTFGTSYYDDHGQAAGSVNVVVDGHCRALTRVRGSTSPAAYEAALSLADGCHAYWFRAATGSKVATYPDSGSLQVAFGGGSGGTCALFTTARAVADCEGATGASPGGDGGAPVDAGPAVDAARAPDLAPAPRPDLGPAAHPDLARPANAPDLAPAPATSMPTTPLPTNGDGDNNGSNSDGGCSIARGRGCTPAPPLAWLALAGAAICRSIKRRARR